MRRPPLELTTWRLGDRRNGPHVLITGGVHGDEFVPMAALRRLDALLNQEALRGQVTLVPVVNESAFLRGQRAGEDGLDLARTCPGHPDGSITERVAHALSMLIQDSDFYIDLHTGGVKLEVFPLTGYMLHPDPNVLDAQRRMARRFGLPIVWGTDPSLDGRSLSVARDANIPAIYAEYLGGAGLDSTSISAYVNGCRNVLADLGVIEGTTLPEPIAPLVVEDARPQSGHMQVQHPSPRSGFFEAAVRIGQRVQPGDTLGTVSDPLGRAVVPVPAERSGVVIVRRTFARVEQGEGLTVVLETDRDPPAWP